MAASACFCSSVPGSRALVTRKTPCAPANAAFSVSGRSRSASTTSSARLRCLLGSRVSARTANWPWACRARTTAPPCCPVAPITAMSFLVFDMCSPPMSGLSLQTRIGSRHPSLKPILLDTIHREWRYIMLDAVTLDQLRTFIAAAEQGSFPAAGRRLRRAQSVVSQTLANLEGQLGVKLFDRGARLPMLTDQGRALLARARAVAMEVDLFKARAKGLASGLETELS